MPRFKLSSPILICDPSQIQEGDGIIRGAMSVLFVLTNLQNFASGQQATWIECQYRGGQLQKAAYEVKADPEFFAEGKWWIVEREAAAAVPAGLPVY